MTSIQSPTTLRKRIEHWKKRYEHEKRSCEAFEKALNKAKADIARLETAQAGLMQELARYKAGIVQGTEPLKLCISELERKVIALRTERDYYKKRSVYLKRKLNN